jgi:hypothetical protein
MDRDSGSPALYRIRIREELGPEGRHGFEGFAVAAEKGGGSVLTGLVQDQAALHGLLRKLRDLGLTLVSLQRAEGPKEKGGRL